MIIEKLYLIATGDTGDVREVKITSEAKALVKGLLCEIEGKRATFYDLIKPLSEAIGVELRLGSVQSKLDEATREQIKLKAEDYAKRHDKRSVKGAIALLVGLSVLT